MKIYASSLRWCLYLWDRKMGRLCSLAFDASITIINFSLFIKIINRFRSQSARISAKYGDQLIFFWIYLKRLLAEFFATNMLHTQNLKPILSQTFHNLFRKRSKWVFILTKNDLGYWFNLKSFQLNRGIFIINQMSLYLQLLVEKTNIFRKLHRFTTSSVTNVKSFSVCRKKNAKYRKRLQNFFCLLASRVVQ